MDGAGAVAADLATPSTPAEAATRLDNLSADPKWRAAYLGGDGPAKKQFDDLIAIKHAPDNLDAIVKGTARPDNTQVDGKTSISDQMSSAADMRALGIPDAAIRQLLEGKPVTKQERDAVLSLRAERMSDPSWATAYLKGSRAHIRDMHLMNIVIAGGHREEQTA